MEETTDSKIDIQHEGVVKRIVGPDKDGYILKFFKEDPENHSYYTCSQQQEIINKKMQYFGKFIPETILIKKDEGHYHVKQKYIKGRLLKDVNIESLPSQTLSDLIELIESYLKYCKDEDMYCDVQGCQKEILEMDDISKRRFMSYNQLFFRSFLGSTNIIISDDNKVYMVDVCDAYLKQGKTQIDKLKRLVKKKIRDIIVAMGTKNILYKIKGYKHDAEIYELIYK